MTVPAEFVNRYQRLADRGINLIPDHNAAVVRVEEGLTRADETNDVGLALRTYDELLDVCDLLTSRLADALAELESLQSDVKTHYRAKTDFASGTIYAGMGSAILGRGNMRRVRAVKKNMIRHERDQLVAVLKDSIQAVRLDLADSVDRRIVLAQIRAEVELEHDEELPDPLEEPQTWPTKPEVFVSQHPPEAFVDGRLYIDWVDEVKQLKRDGQLVAARDLLVRLCDAAIADADGTGGVVAPWYFEHLAIIQRELKDNAGEVATLERYHATPHGYPQHFTERLTKARSLARQ